MESIVISMGEVDAGMAHGVMCEGCSMERHWTATECRLCEVLARNAVLEEEIKELRGLWSETKQELGVLRQQVLEIRGEGSVRSWDRSEAGEGNT